MDDVILVYIKDYEVNGEWELWNIFSQYASDEDIEAEINKAKFNGEMSEDAEYMTERWTIL